MASSSQPAHPDEDEWMSAPAVTAVWTAALIGGLFLLLLLTQWGVLDDVPAAEAVMGVAIGTSSGVGIVAIGGWNAIGLFAIGGANSIGVISIGGFNSIGVVSFGGLNSIGFIAFGGLNAVGFRGSSIFGWAPRPIRNGSSFAR